MTSNRGKADEYLRVLMEDTSDYIMIADAQGKPQVFNDAYARVMRETMGLDMKPGIQPHKFVDDPAIVAFWDDLHRRALKGEVFTVEYAHPMGDDTRHFSVSFHPIIKDGEVQGFSEVTRDITSLKSAAEALKRSEQFLSESQQAAGVGTYELDIAQNRWTSSPTLDAILGLDPDFEYSVEGWVSLVHPDWRQDMAEYFEVEVLGKRQRFNREYQIVRPSDGVTRWVHGLGRLGFSSEGEALKLVGTIQDITERKELEASVRHAEKMEAVGQLAGGVAHDFNNQLTAIAGFAEAARTLAADDPAKARDYVDRILMCTERAGDLTAKLLAFSRKGNLVTRPVDLHEVLHEIIAILDRSIDRRINVEFDLEAEISWVEGDPSQLQAMLLNVALNARDALNEGGTIRFTTQTMEFDDSDARPANLPAGRYLEVSIRDTGPGIDPEVLPRIWEPFFTTKAQGEGTGMGLAAAYGTARAHQGIIEARNHPDGGAAFCILLPLSHRTGVRRPTTPVRPATARSRRHILLVDDDEMVRLAIRLALEQGGYRVTTCRDGIEAVEVFCQEPKKFDLVLLDLMMPRQGGVETFRRLREKHPDALILIASGFGLKGDAQELIDQGAAGFIAKPFSIYDLETKLNDVL